MEGVIRPVSIGWPKPPDEKLFERLREDPSGMGMRTSEGILVSEAENVSWIGGSRGTKEESASLGCNVALGDSVGGW